MEETALAREQFKALWQSIGLSVNWNYVYSTISDVARKVSQRSFIDLFEKGLAYRTAEPALYCTDFRTTVAQAELESVEKKTLFSTITFDVECEGSVSVATTRPELLSSCVAIFYHPDDSRYQALKGKNSITPIFGKKVPFLADDLVDIEKGTGVVMCCTFGDQTDIEWFK
jgi:valyl-tRNA synthetase